MGLRERGVLRRRPPQPHTDGPQCRCPPATGDRTAQRHEAGYPAGKKDAVPKRLRELAIRPSLAPLKCCGGSRGSFIQEWKFDDTPAWPTKDIRSVMAISGPCDMCHLHANAPLFVSFQKVTESVFLN
eukprot:4355_1